MVEVNGAALAVGVAGIVEHKLGEDLDYGSATVEEDAVVAVGNDDAVLLAR